MADPKNPLLAGPPPEARACPGRTLGPREGPCRRPGAAGEVWCEHGFWSQGISPGLKRPVEPPGYMEGALVEDGADRPGRRRRRSDPAQAAGHSGAGSFRPQPPPRSHPPRPPRLSIPAEDRSKAGSRSGSDQKLDADRPGTTWPHLASSTFRTPCADRRRDVQSRSPTWRVRRSAEDRNEIPSPGRRTSAAGPSSHPGGSISRRSAFRTLPETATGRQIPRQVWRRLRLHGLK